MKALLITYVFPPTGGVGSERVRKLAKFLPDHDVTPSVLTATNPSVPLVDQSILADVAPDLRVLRARTLEPGYGVKQVAWATSANAGVTNSSRWSQLKQRATRVGRQALIPDPQVLWLPDVYRVLGSQLFRPRSTADVVFITAPPFSSFLASPIARLRPGTAVVIDYRDEWETSRKHYEMLGGRIAATAGSAMERAVLPSAHVITTATEAFRENLLNRFSFLDPSRVITIPNGYDPDDFPSELPEPPKDRLVITYAGTVYKLTSPRGFLAAIRLLHEREPELAKLLEVRFIGRIVDTELDAFADMEQLGVKRVGFVEKDRVAPEQAAGHMVLCLQDDLPGNERVYQAKIFELMYLKRPCLTLAPRGALQQLVERHQLGRVINPRDSNAIAEYLAETIRRWRDGSYSILNESVDIEQYHRRELAGRFAEAFRLALSVARP